MKNDKRILIAVDGSKASQRTVAYVADMVAGTPSFHVGLLHLELPPRMLEWGGSENPHVEDMVESERAEHYQELEHEVVQKGRAGLEQFQKMLTGRGVDVMGRFVQFEEPLDSKTITKAILEAAKEHACGTVVVGRHSFAGWRRFFERYVGAELIREAKGVTVWVVE